DLAYGNFIRTTGQQPGLWINLKRNEEAWGARHPGSSALPTQLWKTDRSERRRDERGRIVAAQSQPSRHFPVGCDLGIGRTAYIAVVIISTRNAQIETVHQWYVHI